MDSDADIDEEKVAAMLLPVEHCKVPELSEQFVDQSSASDAVFRKPRPNQILGPVPDAALLDATRAWLVQRDLTLEDLHSCMGLCKILDITENLEGYRKRYRLFVEGALYADIPLEDLPTMQDIRFERNWPKLICAVAHLARTRDGGQWNACLEAAGALHPTHWRDAMRNERWEGDATARQIARLVGSHCTFTVAGTQGSGKSETVRTLLGRQLFRASHALSYEQDPETLTEEERSDIEKKRHLTAVNWPSFPILDNMPFGSSKADMAHVKVDGVVLSFLELPEMNTAFDHVDSEGQEVIHEFGSIEKVQRDIQGEHPRVVFVVERLDDFHEKPFRELVAKLRRLFGNDMFYRIVIILTHGYSYPPGQMSYQVWVFDQVRQVRECLRKVWKKCPHVPVVVVENSEHCPTVEGHRILPNGEDFVQNFINSLDLVLQRGQREFELVPTPLRGWWECYALVGLIAVLLMRLR
ncbi:unnamed protein product [Agarophyton chilense]